MTLDTLLLTLAGLSYIGVVIITANRLAHRAPDTPAVSSLGGRDDAILGISPQPTAPTSERWLRAMLYGVVAMNCLTAFNVLARAEVVPPADALAQGLPVVAVESALVACAVSMVTVTISVAALQSAPFRRTLQRFIGVSGAFKPHSPVHLTALVLALAFIAITISQLVLGGGVEGVAQAIQTTGISSVEVLFTGLLWVVFALLGVGIVVRRSLRAALDRLGLRVPTLGDVRAAVFGAALLFAFQLVAGAAWLLITPAEDFAAQTSAAREVSAAINSIVLAVVVSASAAIGEEIFFRGAFQPVFGIGLTSVFFVLVHSQYSFTFATFIILGVSLGLGWLRARHSTTAAILAHFLYNLVLTLGALAAGTVTP